MNVDQVAARSMELYRSQPECMKFNARKRLCLGNGLTPGHLEEGNTEHKFSTQEITNIWESWFWMGRDC